MSRYPLLKFFDKWFMIGNYHASGPDMNMDPVPPEGWVNGGDTTQRVGMYYLGLKLAKELGADITQYPYQHNFGIVQQMLQDWDTGNFIRHPDTRYWYSDLDRGSRDQTMPMLMGLSECGLSLRDAIWAHAKRLFLFATNTRWNGATRANHGRPFLYAPPLTAWQKFVIKHRIPLVRLRTVSNYNWRMPDITGPSVWAVYLRHGIKQIPALKWPLYPVLCVLDLEFFVNSVLKRTLAKHDTDVVNHVIEGVYFARNTPTFFVHFTNNYVNSAEDLDLKVRAYFGYDIKYGRWPWFMYELWKPIIAHYFKADK